MSILLTKSSIENGPLPETDLDAYSFNPITSSVTLVQLRKNKTKSKTINALCSPLIHTNGQTASIEFSQTFLSSDILLEYTIPLEAQVFTDILFQLTGTSGKVYNAIVTRKDYFSFSLKNTYLKDDLSQETSFTKLKITITKLTSLNSLDYAQVIIGRILFPIVDFIPYENTFDQYTKVTSGSLINWTIASYNFISLAYQENITNTSWGYIHDNEAIISTQTLAPFPPPFYDTDWYNYLDYPETTSFTANYIQHYATTYDISEAFSSMPSLKNAIRLIADIYTKGSFSAYNLGVITQETDRQLLWRLQKATRSIFYSGTTYTYTANYWTSSENVYLYNAGGVYFGGRNYAGPLNTVLITNQDGTFGAEYTIIDLNEFKVDSNNNVIVDSYVCNYSETAIKVYCLLDKTTGRSAEIDKTTHTIKYFNLLVPADSYICNFYYSNRLMYTVYNSVANTYSLFDAHNNGVLVDSITLIPEFDPEYIQKFTIIN